MQPTMMRAFIAIQLPPEIHAKLSQISRQLRDPLKDIPIRWVQPESIHLTLKFLGQVSQPNMDLLKNVLIAEASRFSPFQINIGKLGAFPNPRRPRVIWIGVESPPELKTLQRNIDQHTQRLGYPGEDRPFSAHLTLARIARNASTADQQKMGEVLANANVGLGGTTIVQAVNLYKSDLKPGGAVYTCLHAAPLVNQSIP